jgi:two-component system, LuxR family, response regulator FixJ
VTAARGGLVVVVDDDASVRRGLERLLRSVGYAVETFESARAFLDRGEYDRADCLVFDVRMPGQTGLDLQRVLVDAGYDLPILFVTGHGDLPMAEQALKGGAVDFIAKPFDDDVFLEAVRQATLRGRPPPRADADHV